jgi:hypothetical protein
MPRKAVPRETFETRRRKEDVAFLVVKFLKAYLLFAEILREFRNAVRDKCLASCGLHNRIGDLQSSLAFDIKERAHSLFRTAPRAGNAGSAVKPPSAAGDGGSGGRAGHARRSVHELKAGIETRSIDSFVGTGYHLLMILQESLYQLERYAPAYEKEQEEISRFEALARRIGYAFSQDEMSELEHLRALSAISARLSGETEQLTIRLMERCEELFKGTAEVLRHFIEGAADNEILVQNLIQNLGLFEAVYGEGSGERIFWVMFRHRGIEGSTGLEKAEAFARGRCGNTTGLSP